MKLFRVNAQISGLCVMQPGALGRPQILVDVEDSTQRALRMVADNDLTVPRLLQRWMIYLLRRLLVTIEFPRAALRSPSVPAMSRRHASSETWPSGSSNS